MVVKNELGSRSLVAYLTGVVVTALIMGLGLDYLLTYFDITITVSLGEHSDMSSVLYSVAAIILVCLIGYQYIKLFKAKLLERNVKSARHVKKEA